MALRVQAPWAAGLLVLNTGFVCYWFFIAQIEEGIWCGNLKTPWAGLCLLSAAALGGRAWWDTRSPAGWGLLVHRPVSRRRMFAARIGVGVLLQLVVTVVPWLLACLLHAAPGLDRIVPSRHRDVWIEIPFVPELIWPGIAISLIAIALQFAVALGVLRVTPACGPRYAWCFIAVGAIVFLLNLSDGLLATAGSLALTLATAWAAWSALAFRGTGEGESSGLGGWINRIAAAFLWIFVPGTILLPLLIFQTPRDLLLSEPDSRLPAVGLHGHRVLPGGGSDRSPILTKNGAWEPAMYGEGAVNNGSITLHEMRQPRDQPWPALPHRIRRFANLVDGWSFLLPSHAMVVLTRTRGVEQAGEPREQRIALPDQAGAAVRLPLRFVAADQQSTWIATEAGVTILRRTADGKGLELFSLSKAAATQFTPPSLRVTASGVDAGKGPGLVLDEGGFALLVEADDGSVSRWPVPDPLNFTNAAPPDMRLTTAFTAANEPLTSILDDGAGGAWRLDWSAVGDLASSTAWRPLPRLRPEAGSQAEPVAKLLLFPITSAAAGHPTQRGVAWLLLLGSAAICAVRGKQLKLHPLVAAAAGFVGGFPMAASLLSERAPKPLKLPESRSRMLIVNPITGGKP